VLKMKRTLLHRRGLLPSMVRRVYRDSSDVPRFSLGTLVLRIWASQPIGRKDRRWESHDVKRGVLRGVGVANATHAASNWEQLPARERFEVAVAG
jgi:hypothetical protein